MRSTSTSACSGGITKFVLGGPEFLEKKKPAAGEKKILWAPPRPPETAFQSWRSLEKKSEYFYFYTIVFDFWLHQTRSQGFLQGGLAFIMGGLHSEPDIGFHDKEGCFLICAVTNGVRGGVRGGGG